MKHGETPHESFKAWRNGDPYRHIPWHYHPEYELTYIHRGYGELFVGDKLVDYDHEEIVLFGPNLPHEWRSKKKDDPDYYSESVSIHFGHNFVGESFYNLSESKSLINLLEIAKRGIRVTHKKTKRYVKEKLFTLPETTGLNRIITLLQILEKISESSELELMSSSSFTQSTESIQDFKVNKIYEFVLKNFMHSISVTEAANIVNMTKTSFCRFFKERTNKSFIQYVNEIRIGYACKLLLEGELSISQVAFDSGFENISYFNRQFKQLKDYTPTEYREMFFTKDE
ncbi:AraC family transcriptional regulator [Membranihabitans marinus]